VLDARPLQLARLAGNAWSALENVQDQTGGVEARGYVDGELQGGG
jgi:hypothetical protein